MNLEDVATAAVGSTHPTTTSVAFDETKEQKLKRISGISCLSDEVVLQKMFASNNGKKMGKIYNSKIPLYKNKLTGKDENSATDMALVNTLAYWTNKDAAQIERIWLDSPRGKAYWKTQKRRDYRVLTMIT